VCIKWIAKNKFDVETFMFFFSTARAMFKLRQGYMWSLRKGWKKKVLEHYKTVERPERAPQVGGQLFGQYVYQFFNFKF